MAALFSGPEAAVTFVLIMIATGILNAVGQDLWIWLRGYVARRLRE